MTDRRTLSQSFLQFAGWGLSARAHLAGDASDRSYDRLTLGHHTAILMDAPPGCGDDPAIFVSIDAHLTALGLSAPKILAQDLTHGFLLLEDLGDALFARDVARDPALEAPLYAAATDVLIHLQSAAPAPNLPNLTPLDWANAATFALTWYRFAITGDHTPSHDFTTTLTDLITTHANGPRVMCLRDYHAENLLWLPDRRGIARVGLLDFQLAQLSQPGYDLVSLLQDARRDVSAATETTMITRMIATTGHNATQFRTAYAILGAQRALRILGIFAKLCLQDAKPHYLPLIPRVWGQLQRNLAHPALAPLAAICANLLPEPTPANLHKIGLQCGKHPAP
jgi:N-acetylmuramate 1-kinase